MPTIPSVITPTAKMCRAPSVTRTATAWPVTAASRPLVRRSSPTRLSESSAPRSAHASGWDAAANRVSRFQKPKALMNTSAPAPKTACPTALDLGSDNRPATTQSASPPCVSAQPTRPSAREGVGIPNSVGNERSPTPLKTPKRKPKNCIVSSAPS